MSIRLEDGTVIIAAEEPDTCEECGAFAETRPYGVGGKRICFDCGIKDKAGTEARMRKILFGESVQ